MTLHSSHWVSKLQHITRRSADVQIWISFALLAANAADLSELYSWLELTERLAACPAALLPPVV
jgi:hypothetical protein